MQREQSKLRGVLDNPRRRKFVEKRALIELELERSKGTGKFVEKRGGEICRKKGRVQTKRKSSQFKYLR